MKVINLGMPIRAEEEIKSLGTKRLENTDVRFQNVHLKQINDLTGRKVFTKNDLFMDAGGLWDILSKEKLALGRHHHCHNLSPKSVVAALLALQHPELVVAQIGTRRYVVVSLSVEGKAVLAVIEVNAPLRNDRNANINKLVTLYAKEKYPEYLRRLEKRVDVRILYKK